MSSSTADVIVIGAGFAGLMAAYRLSGAGMRVVILEARERLGGRAHTVQDDARGVPIELGAEFIHGTPPETFTLARQAGLVMMELKGEYWLAVKGAIQNDSEDDGTDVIFAGLDGLSDDLSFEEYVRTRFSGDDWQEARTSAISFVEGYHAARAERISALAVREMDQAGEAIQSEMDFKLAAGYGALVEWLRVQLEQAGVEICTGRVVREIRWSAGSVSITAEPADGKAKSSFQAARAVITLPLGVLKAKADEPGGVRFTPDLAEKRAAMEQIDMGEAARITLRFRKRFWEEPLPIAKPSGKPLFLLVDHPFFPVWWTPTPLDWPILTGWVGGTQASKLRGESGRVWLDQAVDALSQLFGLATETIRGEIEAVYHHNWMSDPYARGAYSYPAVGGLNAASVLAEPVADTLFFAGEATHSGGHMGTVHGAITTGERAARQILEKWKR
ncbi:MAG: FAD-dependent oxidoreductase [Anaerolineae bacterium]|nr:FAD-dependent oxidoreductase [Anaerolineae bacterium]